MTTFFTADTHFGHLGAMKKFRRPFQDVREMNQTLITNWNGVVQPTDWVFHLGDFGKWTGVNLGEVFNLLNGTRVLIVGNHDTPETLCLPWRERAESAFVTVGGHRIWLSHHPRKSWKEKGTGRGTCTVMSTGVSVWGDFPLTWGQIVGVFSRSALPKSESGWMRSMDEAVRSRKTFHDCPRLRHVVAKERGIGFRKDRRQDKSLKILAGHGEKRESWC